MQRLRQLRCLIGGLNLAPIGETSLLNAEALRSNHGGSRLDVVAQGTLQVARERLFGIETEGICREGMFMQASYA